MQVTFLGQIKGPQEIENKENGQSFKTQLIKISIICAAS